MGEDTDKKRDKGEKQSGVNGGPQPPRIRRQLLVWMVIMAATMIVLMMFRRTAEPRVEETGVTA